MAVGDTVHEVETRVFAAGYEAYYLVLYARKLAHFFGWYVLYSLTYIPRPDFGSRKVKGGNVDRSRGCYVKAYQCNDVNVKSD